MLSKRGRSKVQALDLPWRFAPRGTYHPEDNPDGLISFATAENVNTISSSSVSTSVPLLIRGCCGIDIEHRRSNRLCESLRK